MKRTYFGFALGEILSVIGFGIVCVWMDTCLADDCRRRGGTTVTGGSQPSVCIEHGHPLPTSHENSR